MSIYSPRLTPATAAAAYSLLPSDWDYQMVAAVNPARANIQYAKHAVLELRSESTGRRRKFRNGKLMIPLTDPTDDFELLESGLALGVALAEKVNEWIKIGWINSIDFIVEEWWPVTGSYATMFDPDGAVSAEAREWLDQNVGKNGFARRGKTLAFKDSRHAAGCKLVFG